MEGSPRHASETAISDAYRHFFSSEISFSQLKNAALTDRLFPRSKGEVPGVPGRSIAWKLFLAKHEPLQSLPPRVSTLLQELKESRGKFMELLATKTRAPDGSVGYGAGTSPPNNSAFDMVRNLDLNNPLSLHNENPWNEWFAGLELRKTISQDVERTFPEIPFFRDPDVQEQLTNVLFIYSTTHPHIGYRQGMHELLAPLYYAVSFDSVDEASSVESDLQEICSRRWLAADAWALFDAVMNGVSVWYEWQESDPRVSVNGSQGTLSGHVHLNIPEGQNGIQPYIAPIVKACNYIQNDLLKKCDPLLWKSMQNAGIEPQIYGIRWLRLLFTREFMMPDVMRLWDGLFACDPTISLAQWVCVAMLVRIRNELINADYSSQLTSLLRYPPPPAKRVDSSPNHTCILLQQALSLQMSPSPATAATVTMENRSLLNIATDVPESSPLPVKRRPLTTRSQSGFATGRSTAEGDQGHGRLGHNRQASSPLGLPEMFARGLLERGESLGINKTLISAVTELKKNIPDIGSLIKVPTQSIPLEDEPSERPSWEPRLRPDISELQWRDKRLGESLGWIVDTLLQDEGSVDDLQRLQRQRREAVESLSYIRDVLISNTINLDNDRLVSEEEALQRKRQAKHQAEEAAVAPVISMVAQPVPASVVDSRARHSDRKVTRSPPPSFSTTRSVVRSSISEGSNLQRAAPWNHTRSSFTSPITAVPPSSLPRRPPPTSTGTIGVTRGKPGEKLGDQSSTGVVAPRDPLGALG